MILSRPNTAACETMTKTQSRPLKLRRKNGDIVFVSCKNITTGENKHKKGPPLIKPWITNKDDVEEIKRLMRRGIRSETDRLDYECTVCYDRHHICLDCPWLQKIPPGRVVGPKFDDVCIGCGKIGLSCCLKGTRAVHKRCDFCSRNGHWFWEDRCDEYFHPGPWLRKVWSSIKEEVHTEQPLNNSVQACVLHSDMCDGLGETVECVRAYPKNSNPENLKNSKRNRNMKNKMNVENSKRNMNMKNKMNVVVFKDQDKGASPSQGVQRSVEFETKHSDIVRGGKEIYVGASPSQGVQRSMEFETKHSDIVRGVKQIYLM